MTQKQLENLFEKGLLTEERHLFLQSVQSKKVFSLYYELRTLLYLGVLLFSTGVGILIYNNIGQAGHYIALLLLLAATTACLAFVLKRQEPFRKVLWESTNPYFDYSLLLACSLFIIDLGYIEFLFGWFTGHLSIISLITAVFFFYLAYRYDHLGVLSLGITALASFWGLAITPQRWYDFNFFEEQQLQWVAVGYGASLFAGALVLKKFGIKPHFSTTYLNFGVIIAFLGLSSLMFNMNDENYGIALLQLFAAAALAAYSFYQKTVLYIIYAYIFGFIALSYLIAISLKDFDFFFWMLYLIAVSAGFLVLIFTLRKRFKHDA
jgi:hypothetical protein